MNYNFNINPSKKIVFVLFTILLISVFAIPFAYAQISNSSNTTLSQGVASHKSHGLPPSVQNIPSVNSTHVKPLKNKSHVMPYHVRNPTSYAIDKMKANSHLKSSSNLSPLSSAISSMSMSPLSGVNSYSGFDGIDVSSSGGYDPPDVQVATGPNHVFEMINLDGQIYNKQGSPIKTWDLSQLFGFSGSDHLTDPKILYDSQTGRWFATLLDASSDTVGIAVSPGSDPTVTNWYVYHEVYNTQTHSECPDQPKLGVSNDKFVISTNDFEGTVGHNCDQGTPNNVGAEYRVFDKTQMLTGNFVRLLQQGPNISDFAVTPVQSMSSTLNLYMVSDGAVSGTNQIRLFNISGNSSAGVNINTSTVHLNTNILTAADAPQPITSTLLDTGDTRILDANWYKGKLWLSLNDGCTPKGDSQKRSCARLIEINTNTTALMQDFDINSTNTYFYYPALMSDSFGGTGVVTGLSNSTSYPSLMVTGISALDPTNTYENLSVLKIGSQYDDTPDVSPSLARYGDYFGASLDPSDTSLYWVAGEYNKNPPSHSEFTPTWSTFIGSFKIPSFTLSPASGTVGTTVTVTGSGFAASSTVTIKYDGTTIATAPNPVTTNSIGSFSATFTVPTKSASGANTVLVTDASSNTASATFTATGVSHLITLSPTSGTAGNTTVTVSGSGFAASSTITIKYDTKAVVTNPNTITTNATGGFSGITFTVPTKSAAGANIILATDTSSNTASATFTATGITHIITLNPIQGSVGTSVTVTGSGFAASSTVTIKYDGNIMTTNPSTVTTNATGGFSSVTFTVPSSGVGSHTVLATDLSSNTASSTFTVLPASVFLSPTNGHVGTKVTVSGSGYQGTSRVTIEYDGSKVTTIPSTITTNSSGGFSGVTFNVPQSIAGANTVQVNDTTNIGTTTFTVTPSVSLSTITGSVGTTVTVSGTGYKPSSTVIIKYDDNTVLTTPSTVSTNASGIFSATFTVPPSAVGSHTIRATDASSNTAFSSFAVFVTIPVGTYPEEIAFDKNNGYLYVPNVDDNTVSVINGANNTVVATVPVGAGPYGVAFDSTNGYLYVTNLSDNTVSVINGATNTVIGNPIPVGNSPYGATFDSTNGNIYVVNSADNTVSVIKGSTNTVIATISVGNDPSDIAFDSTNGYLYVMSFSDNAVYIINGATNTVIGNPISLFTSFSGIAFDSTNGNIYAAEATNVVDVIKGSTNTIIATIPVGTAPSGITFDSANGYLYVSNAYDNTVSVINGATNTIVGNPIPVGSGPTGIAFDSTNGNLYTANQNDYTVSVIKGSTNTVIATISVGVWPQDVAFDSTNGNIYVTNAAESTVSVIQGSTNTVIATIPVDNEPFGIVFDSKNGYLYVNNYGGNTLSVINGATNTIVGSPIPVGNSPYYGVMFDSTNGNIYVANGNDNNVYAISAASISLSPTTGSVGTTVTVSGSSFTASSTVTIKYDGTTVTTTPTTVTTSSTGTFSATFVIPSSVFGSHAVQATAGTTIASSIFTVK